MIRYPVLSGIESLYNDMRITTVRANQDNVSSTTLDIYTHAFDKNKKVASEALQQSLEI